MIRTAAASRIRLTIGSSSRGAAARIGALAGVAGVLGLTACAPSAGDTGATADPAPAATSGQASSPSADAGASASDSGYADGTYTADGTYATPETVETIEVTVTLADGVITAVEVTGDPQRPETERYQGEFIGGISDEVVGKPIDEISVSRVAGSSLTSGGFNQAVEAIRSEAAQ